MRMKQFRRKESFMDKTINERLFEQLMRAPHAVRRAAIEANFEEDMPGGHHGHGHGPGGCHRHGEGHGPEGCHHHGEGEDHGHGECHHHGEGHGPEGCHHGEGHGPMNVHGPGHCKRHDRGFGRERVLSVIGSYEAGVRQKVLTEELRINPSSVSEMISKLENDGYVKRTVDPTDKRATLISLTELGEARAAELQDEKNEKLDKAFSDLTDDEKEQLIALLEKLTEAK